ncbi:hypothetical protein [Natrarchaeobaculum aegyptiacum]|uniref:Uncharacterized protein n=1 Tax=Natrarchaeobaculum aegyptiacum TaxID=745377 RepID=A0A2Z2HRM0_9EURY|nr:hypothetical protein [Natrarchaeobaculum aegyptiacum]ARS89811.1 hypothetical protein B1756_08695 [Natrarchaeobaculum aegyptiacum]
MGRKPRSRRVILAALGSVAAGSTAAKATDHHEDLDRPRTIEENGIEFTKWDCSRVIIEDHTGRADHINILVRYLGLEMLDDPDDEPQRLVQDLSTATSLPELDGRVDINVNEYAHEVRPERGSIVISEIRVSNSDGEGQLAHVVWPSDEWDCDYVMHQEVE